MFNNELLINVPIHPHAAQVIIHLFSSSFEDLSSCLPFSYSILILNRLFGFWRFFHFITIGCPIGSVSAASCIVLFAIGIIILYYPRTALLLLYYPRTLNLWLSLNKPTLQSHNSILVMSGFDAKRLWMIDNV
jgi:hypothetical protein